MLTGSRGCRQGATGIHDGASQAMLQSEFGTTDEDKCISLILERGEIQEKEVRSYAAVYDVLDKY